MQIASPASDQGLARYETLDIHMQAVECVIQVMHSHMPEDLALEDLASVACLSPYHFNRVFRRLIGIPPVEFLSALRFQAARRLLLTTSLSVTDICFEVGYSSMGSFTTRFTQLVGMSPRLLRQRAHEFEPPLIEEPVEPAAKRFPGSPDARMKNTIRGWISAPAFFQGTIYVGLFTSPIPQGAPVRCTKLHAAGTYALHGVVDGVYYLRSAAFPLAADLRDCLLPGEKILLGSNMSPLVVQAGFVSGSADLVLHPPRLTDPPLVMGLPLL